MSWTKFELTMISLALLLGFSMISYRSYQHYYYESAAEQLVANIEKIASSVANYEKRTGRYFPISADGEAFVRLYPNPFDSVSVDFQGVDAALFDRGNNNGIVLQLVRFDLARDRPVSVHLFETPYQVGEPYLRLLLQYGSQGQVESEILIRAQSRMPLFSLGEIDDHYYVVDLRRFLDG